MKVALLLASTLVVTLAGCLDGLPFFGDHSRLVVHVFDEATVHDAEADPAASFGPRCPDFAYLPETGEREDGPPELRLVGRRDDAHGAVVRLYHLEQDEGGGLTSGGNVGAGGGGASSAPSGASGHHVGGDLVEFDDGSTMSLLSPFLSGPHLARIEIRGDSVVVDDEPLAEGEATTITQTYQVTQEGGSFHVEERLTVANVGRVATKYIHDLACD